MSPRLRGAISALAASAIALLFISGRVWATATLAEPNTPQLQLNLTGRALDPLGAGCAWALLTSAVAYRVTRGFIRRVVAVIAVALSIGSLVSALQSHGAAIGVAIDSAASDTLGRTITNVGFSDNHFWQAALVISLISLLLSLVLVIAPATPKNNARYERKGQASELTSWQALDAGIDPTQDLPSATDKL